MNNLDFEKHQKAILCAKIAIAIDPYARKEHVEGLKIKQDWLNGKISGVDLIRAQADIPSVLKTNYTCRGCVYFAMDMYSDDALLYARNALLYIFEFNEGNANRHREKNFRRDK